MKNIKYYILMCLIFASNIIHAAGFHALTVASDTTVGLKRLIKSSKAFKINLKVLGLGLPYKCNRQKLSYVREYIKDLPDDDVLLFVDGYDVFFTGGKKEILSRFEKMGKDMVMSTEINYSHKPIQPGEKLSYPKAPSRFRYLNSGGYIAKIGKLKEVLAEIEKVENDPNHVCNSDYKKSRSDQILFHNYFLTHPNDSFGRDYKCKLFLSLTRVEKAAVEVDKKGKKVRLIETNTKPVILHGCGKGYPLYKTLFNTLFSVK